MSGGGGWHGLARAGTGWYGLVRAGTGWQGRSVLYLIALDEGVKVLDHVRVAKRLQQPHLLQALVPSLGVGRGSDEGSLNLLHNGGVRRVQGDDGGGGHWSEERWCHREVVVVADDARAARAERLTFASIASTEIFLSATIASSALRRAR